MLASQHVWAPSTKEICQRCLHADPETQMIVAHKLQMNLQSCRALTLHAWFTDVVFVFPSELIKNEQKRNSYVPIFVEKGPRSYGSTYGRLH